LLSLLLLPSSSSSQLDLTACILLPASRLHTLLILDYWFVASEPPDPSLRILLLPAYALNQDIEGNKHWKNTVTAYTFGSLMSGIMANATSGYELPPLPSYTLTPRPSLIPYCSDVLLQLLMPIFAYWIVSGIFHILDTYDFFPQYRLHTPAEILKRNHVTRYEVVKDVVLQQFIQTIFGLVMAAFDPPEMIGKENYDIAMWAQRIRLAQRSIPVISAFIGVDAIKSSNKLYNSYPTLASILAGGRLSTTFESWELFAAKAIYHGVVPFVQFAIAIVIVDSWQYFLHRAMHMNKFLYTTLHSRHHRLYVPYAFGALYNHPLEGFMLDTLGTGVAYLATGMTIRQGLWFFTCSTIKTVDDHCGYAFPWDPLQHITSNNAAYHDVHHQSWGIKTNFSQPFFTFWDRVLGTVWTGGDVSARYERDRIAAQRKVDAEETSIASSVVNSPAIDESKAVRHAAASRKQVFDDKQDGGQRILNEGRREEIETKQMLLRSGRKKSKSGTFDPKSLSERMVGSLHGRTTSILHADGSR
jgi:sphinganine C4-monooxygenase